MTNIDSNSNLVRTGLPQLPVEVRGQLLSYIDSALLAKYLRQRGWSLNEELSTYITLIREGTPSVKLRALEALNRRIELALAREGLLVKATRIIKSKGKPGDPIPPDVLTFSTELVAHSLSEQQGEIESEPTILGDIDNDSETEPGDEIPNTCETEDVRDYTSEYNQ